MSFVVKSGSKQYIVNSGSTFVVDRIKSEIGESVDLELVYAFGDDNGVKKLSAKVVAHQKGKKIRVVKYKSKSNYHKQYGYRHYETVLEVEGVLKKSTNGSVSGKKQNVKETAVKAEKKEVVE